MKKMRVGIIGAGSIADYHIRSFQKDSRVEIAAICDQNIHRARQKAGEYGIRGVFTTPGELLREAEPDAVSILTWTNTHEPIAMDALKAGVHVLCEKPPATSAAGAARMHEAAMENGKLLMFNFIRRFGRTESLAKKYVEQGRIGAVYFAKAGYVRRCGCPGGWFTNKAISGGGALIDLGIHIIDLAGYLMGAPKPVSVFGSAFRSVGGRSNIRDVSWYKASDYGDAVYDVEDGATALIKYDNGATLFIEASWTMNIGEERQYLDIMGDKGGIGLNPKLEIYTEENDRLVNLSPVFDSYAFDMDAAFEAGIAHFTDCVLDGARCICPSEDGVAVMKLIDAIYESSRTGELVRLG
jgi:predicted dehydrogenase